MSLNLRLSLNFKPIFRVGCGPVKSEILASADSISRASRRAAVGQVAVIDLGEDFPIRGDLITADEPGLPAWLWHKLMIWRDFRHLFRRGTMFAIAHPDMRTELNHEGLIDEATRLHAD